MSEAARDSRLLLVMAHPALEKSRANTRLWAASEGLAAVTRHDLYETYPDFVVDVSSEKKKLVEHDIIALQFPFYWYAMPALMKEWFDLVWLHGFAYGKGGTKLAGKTLFVTCTTGGPTSAYHALGYNRFTMEEFLRPLEQTADLCGMVWETPYVVHGARIKSPEALEAEAQRFRARLTGLVGRTVAS
ncbi:MAG: oxidoreductase [Caulobacter sp.]|nr:oxidoreductase [Caulobacter sp.]